MPITHWPSQERPRERLLQLGPNVLSDAELLAVFLHTGIKGKTAVDLARDLLNKFGSLRDLLSAPRHTFCQSKGLGLAKFALLQAALEMGRRHLDQNLQRSDAFTNSEGTKQYFIAQLRHHQREVFACLFLDNRHRILAYEELFHGTINCASIYPREVVKRALHHNAAAVILAHNHPSGITEPSTDDKTITEQLKKALEIVGVRVLDHMIVGEGLVTSFVEIGLM